MSRLHHEIQHFYESMTATPDEQSARQDVVDRITSVVHGLWSGAKVMYCNFQVSSLCDTDLFLFSMQTSYNASKPIEQNLLIKFKPFFDPCTYSGRSETRLLCYKPNCKQLSFFCFWMETKNFCVQSVIAAMSIHGSELICPL